jgi:drug/metabolite transporter (DMT)-like permease
MSATATASLSSDAESVTLITTVEHSHEKQLLVNDGSPATPVRRTWASVLVAVLRKWASVLVAVLATTCWLILAIAMPYYNKLTFDSYLPPHAGASSALTPTLVQMMGASVLLVGVELVHQCVSKRRGSAKPWLFGPPLLAKLAYTSVPAVLYAGVMGTTNTSLKLTSVNLHVILRASSIIWIVILAFLLLKERPTLIAVLCCCGLVAGTVLSSVSFSESFTGDSAGPILLTLSSAVFQAGLIVATRIALTARNGELFGGTADEPFLPLQAVALKMCIATVVLLPLALALDLEGWARLTHAPPHSIALVCAGMVITALFASFQILLQQVAGAISVGVVTMCVLIPQVLLSLILGHTLTADTLHILGYVINPVMATMYAADRLDLALGRKISSRAVLMLVALCRCGVAK